MTHSYEDIIRLDSERTQGRWQPDFDEAAKVKDASGATLALITNLHLKGRRDGNEVSANAQYIAAMPDAVGLLKEFKADNTKLKQLLDRAMQGLEAIANAEAFDSWGDLAGRAETTLADIRKQLDGDSNGG